MMSPEIPEPVRIPPEDTFKTLMDTPWGAVNAGGRVFAHVCPLCGAMTPSGSPIPGVSYTEIHARNHQQVANIFSYLRGQDDD